MFCEAACVETTVWHAWFCHILTLLTSVALKTKWVLPNTRILDNDISKLLKCREQKKNGIEENYLPVELEEWQINQIRNPCLP